jgi:CheY-like chemotaxis protein/HPt (histidine-containing phosphotransfer) domain-containing protein
VRVTLTVRDHGSGMDPNDVARLLEPFQQASSTARRTHGGVGLGLAIVQRLVTAMRGVLHIDSQVGVGTSVSVSLRLAPARALLPVVQAQRLTVTRGERALVVDDSGPARELLRAQLERAGYLVTEAASGAEALAHAARTRFGLVLLDYQMPGSDGAQTALALQRVFAAQREGPRVYLLTANVFAREHLASARWAFDGILEKPVSRDALIALLASAQAPRAQRAVRRARLRSLLDARVVDDLCSLRRADGTSMLSGLLVRLRADQASALRELSRAAEAGELVRVARAAHAVAGNAALLGACAVARRARMLEQRSEQDSFDAEDALRAVPVLTRGWERALEVLEELANAGEC